MNLISHLFLITTKLEVFSMFSSVVFMRQELDFFDAYPTNISSISF
jgi:hypothetical protein